MPTRLEVLEKTFPPIHKEQIGSALNDALELIDGKDTPAAIWIDLEEDLSEEWEIGGPAVRPETPPALLAGE